MSVITVIDSAVITIIDGLGSLLQDSQRQTLAAGRKGYKLLLSSLPRREEDKLSRRMAQDTKSLTGYRSSSRCLDAGVGLDEFPVSVSASLYRLLGKGNRKLMGGELVTAVGFEDVPLFCELVQSVTESLRTDPAGFS